MTQAPERTWLYPVLRAVAAAIVALAITFSADHSVQLGYLTLGGFAIATGAVITVGALRGAYPRKESLWQGVLLAVVGVIVLVFSQNGLAYLLFVTSILIGGSGILELIAGLRSRGRFAGARDWVFIGALSALFAIVVLLIPADFVQVITVPDKVVPPLTASVILVGALGAYAAIVAVYLGIAGFSLKWAPSASTPVSEA